MYIEPNSTIHILRDVHIDMSYEHTIWFDSLSAQYTYFHSKTKYSYSKQYYQRHDRGIIRLQQNANELFDCNYLMFQNISYGAKWFYAFITDVEYINDTVCAVHYELDDMQTWFFNQDCTVEPCFVQREHSVTDNIGDNLIPENLELGDYVVTYPDSISVLHTTMGSNGWGDNHEAINWRVTNWCLVVVLNSYALNTLPCHLNFTGGVGHQCAYKIWECNSTKMQQADQWLQSMGWSWLSQAITAIYMFPKNYLPTLNYDSVSELYWGSFIPTDGYTDPDADTSFGIQRDTTHCYDFTPQNNKLFTFPYNFLRVSNGQGSVVDYKWERFATDWAYFRIFGSLSANPSLTLFPTGYKNIGGLVEQEKLTISDLPVVTHATNDFTAKLVQKSIGMALTAVGVGVGGKTGAYLAGNAGATKGATTVTSTTQKLNKDTGRLRTVNKTTKTTDLDYTREYENEAKLGKAAASVASIIGDTSAGASVGDSNTALSVGLLDFTAYRMHITNEFAHIIDDFFSMYGYATNRVKVPNMTSRPHWNYVKTTNCNIHGGMPASAMENIQNIFNAGITFWKNGDEVGDYTLDNRPIITP